MKLTIITINRNNADGLDKTMQSVASQNADDFEYVVVDGASTDGSVAVIRRFAEQFGNQLKWISEPDNGIYNAMNKGIKMATGAYVQFLNSGDCLASEDVVARMSDVVEKNGGPSIIYGNMLKDLANGHRFRDRCFAGQDITFLGFYTGTLNHSPTFIKRELFDRYGLYDEGLKIVSDWKWFLQAIILGEEKPVYSDIDVSVFDMTGISETNQGLVKEERKKVLEKLLPRTVLADYEKYNYSIYQVKRLQRHPWAYKLVWFLERCLFKLEKMSNKLKASVQWQ